MRLASLTLLLFAVLATTAAADLDDSAVLNPNGLGDLRVGLSEGEAEAVLGRKIKISFFPGSDCGTANIGHRSYGLFTGGRLRRVTLQGDFWGTRTGIRVGDDEEAITEQYANAKRSRHAYVEGYYYKVKRGNRKLVFETEKGEITAIHGGRRPEVDYIEGCA
jgi:hypothetical protein